MQLDYIRLHWDKETKRWDRRCVAFNPDFIKECSNQSIFNDSATNKL